MRQSDTFGPSEMAFDSNTGPPAKRRKKQPSQSSNLVTIGNKTISLDRFLDPSPSETATPPIKENNFKEFKQAEAGLKEEKNIVQQPGRRAGSGREDPNRDGEETTISKARKELPIWQHRTEIQKSLREADKNILVVVGETGSGKSTQVPQFLFREPWCRRHRVRLNSSSASETMVGGSIAVTQPRRIAATTLAHRVSQEVGTPLGKRRSDGLVGYSVRFDHQVPRGTKIKFLTEGTLLQELLRDPYLRQYSAVIVDEIHERSLDVDLLVGFLKQILAGNQEKRGGIPLKVIIMSATADVDVFCSFFGQPARSDDSIQVVRIQGRQFPVQLVYEPHAVPNIQDALLQKIIKIHLEEPLPGDILAFLTGQEDIESAQKSIEEYAASLASNLPKVKVCPLYGQLSIDGQREAFLPARNRFTRKIVLATNIAETSVTVPGVRYVVDGGKAKVKQYRSQVGLESLLAKPISKSSAIQRAGRAGREGPGKCFRLYTEEAFSNLPDADVPEILRNDVLDAVLALKARGVQDVMTFPLLNAPAPKSIETALLDLHFLGALNDGGCITAEGEKMAKLPIPAPLGAVLLAAARPEYDCVAEAIDIIACITSGEDIFLQTQSEEEDEEKQLLRREVQRREGDLVTYLTAMQQYAAETTDRTGWCKQRKINIRNMKQAINIRRQLRVLCVREKLVSENLPAETQPFRPLDSERAEVVLQCFMRAFALKTAILEPGGNYVTVQGKHSVAIHPASVLRGQKREAIMFLEHVYTTKSYVKRVSAIRATWIVDALEKRYERDVARA